MGDRRSEYVSIEAGRDAVVLGGGGTQSGLWLRLQTGEGSRARKDASWSDAEGKPLEQQLGAMFDRLELVIKAAAERRGEEARRAAERRRRWEAAMAEARKQFAEQYRKDALRERIERAAEAEDIRAYVVALCNSAASADPSRREDILAWAEWAQTYANDVDPVRRCAGMPPTPQLRPDDLRRYLHGWSPWGAG